MRRTFDEFSAEVYRRRDAIVEKKKKRRVFMTRLAPIALCLVLSFSVLTVMMPRMLSGNAPAPDMDNSSGSMMENDSVMNGADSNGGYLMEIAYVTVDSEEESTVYSDPDDIWDVFVYVEDYPEDFKYYKNDPSIQNVYYKVTVCLRDGTTHYYVLDRLGDQEVRDGFRILMESLNTL